MGIALATCGPHPVSSIHLSPGLGLGPLDQTDLRSDSLLGTHGNLKQATFHSGLFNMISSPLSSSPTLHVTKEGKLLHRVPWSRAHTGDPGESPHEHTCLRGADKAWGLLPRWIPVSSVICLLCGSPLPKSRCGRWEAPGSTLGAALRNDQCVLPGASSCFHPSPPTSASASTSHQSPWPLIHPSPPQGFLRGTYFVTPCSEPSWFATAS